MPLFVAGADDLIDEMVRDLDGADKGFTLLFSAGPFPGYQAEFQWRREEFDGNWYFSAQWDKEGWFCPALFHYFDAAPPTLYVQVRK